MKREPVNSESLCTVGYDPDQRILEAEFVNGTVYRYSNVPRSTFLSLMAADSKGAYFNRRIRDRYVCKKVK